MTIRRPRPLFAAVPLAALALQACAVGPNYVRPVAPTPVAYKEQAGWTPAQPLDAIPKGAWWSVYGDPVLDGLEKRVAVSNQNVIQAYAAYREARQLTAEDRASFFPTVTATGSATRSKGRSGVITGGTTTTTGTTGSTGSTGTGTGTGSTATTGTGTGTGSGTGLGTGTGTTTTTGAVISSGGTTYSAQLGASWAPDIWGKIRRTVEGDVANAQASAADLANATLSAQAQLAASYVDLRILDEEKRLYNDTIAAYRRSLQLTQNQYNAGVIARADVITAQTQVLNVQAQAADIDTQRAQDEHVIALLVGVTPDQLTIAPTPISRTVPVAPVGVASALLQRRPDIAAAERAVKQANANIGVATAAYFPDLTLSGSYGYSGSNLGSLFRAPNELWSYGGDLAETLLDFGARRARVRQARAIYDERVAQYRQTVLTAFQGVEDQLAALRVLEGEAAIRDQALAAARRSEALALNQYRAGTVDFTTVVTAQATALAAAQSQLTVLRARQQASVTLIEDLGGGWEQADLPKR